MAAAAVTVATLAAAGIANVLLARRAERMNPPAGQFLDIDGVRLHYVERGSGDVVVLLHGNGSLIEDFDSSGLIAKAAKTNRVIAFDRPGFGHSNRPRRRLWTPDAQAQLILRALDHLGVERATILGHSWGASVAVAMAMRNPTVANALVLASGYFYPTVRADVVAMSAPAIPIIGDLVRYTVAPLASRLMWPALLRKIFGPAPVPKKFDGFPKEMAVRPSQLRASAEESACMIPDAVALRHSYAKLSVPVVIIAGEQDRLIDIDKQSARLHAELPRSTLHRIPGSGHMVHQTATDAVVDAIDEATAAARGRMKPVHIPSAA